MSEKDFIKNKLSLMKKDKQAGFEDFVGPLQNMAEKHEVRKTVQIPAHGSWFEISFNAVEIKKDRLVISAKRKQNGLVPTNHDPSEKEYVVTFQDTRAAYIRDFYKHRHPVGGWPYISWDVRSYANHPQNKEIRVYVHGFRAREEIRRLILAMERFYGTSNIVNKYIKDNLFHFRAGINMKKTPQEIEKAWSQGLMESIGYNHVEAKDTGLSEGSWNDVTVHWCKKQHDLRWQNDR